MEVKNNLKWLYLDFNSYFATIEQQVNPALRNKPVAIVPSITDYTCAIAASYEAKKLGIKTGTMIYEAKKICPKLICVQADHEKYIYYHHKLIREINKYIPIEQVCSIDEVACKLLGKECLPKTIVRKAIAIKKAIKRNVGDYISCSIGISSNKFLAKTASNLQKPNGLKIINKKKILKRINHLKLSDLTGIGKRMESKLFLSGITSIQKLYDLSPKNMRKIWGNVLGERFWYMLRGKDIEDIHTQTRTIGHSHVLHPDWRTTQRSREVMRRLIVKAASRLRRKEFVCTNLKMSLKTITGKKMKATEKFQKLNDSFSLLEKADYIWKKLIHDYRINKIIQISVVLHGLHSTKSVQTSLLEKLENKDQKNKRKKRSISQAIDTINSRFGRDSVTIGSLPRNMLQFSGTKVAFTRIPEIKEFYE
ncbi:MAG: DNA polymerase IV [Alphaproteobacteria bacterium MarineAlpha9_Bin4]|nr:impB/mucB/samB family protein [Pelagibacterales bacterium]PPR27645.1 MAG: DNA polymerase IV [Alphaproteobacteria bacterium MarineAlpha9_Bin4]|tara:strand:- start:650 stop:1915 length:1266 start_codon:yes stop_codon:yes gene_type:complete